MPESLGDKEYALMASVRIAIVRSHITTSVKLLRVIISHQQTQ